VLGGRAPGELAGVQSLALHLDDQPVVAEVLPVCRRLADGVAVRPGVIFGRGPRVTHAPTQPHATRAEQPTLTLATEIRLIRPVPLGNAADDVMHRLPSWPVPGDGICGLLCAWARAEGSAADAGHGGQVDDDSSRTVALQPDVDVPGQGGRIDAEALGRLNDCGPARGVVPDLAGVNDHCLPSPWRAACW
jgi:hypothetical protein